MDDLISRQAAIDRLTEYGNGRAVFISVGEAIIRIEQLPPAQLSTNMAEVGTDCISRQAAIDALDEIEAEVADGYGYQYAKWRKYFCDLPPAQPEQLEQCPIYGGMCAYPSDQCYDCPRHAGAKMEVTE